MFVETYYRVSNFYYFLSEPEVHFKQEQNQQQFRAFAELILLENYDRFYKELD